MSIMQFGKKYPLADLLLLSAVVFIVFSIFPGPVRSLEVEYLPTSVNVQLACGDGLAENPEICDPGLPPDVPPDLAGGVCQDFADIFGDPFLSGTLLCASDCANYATSSCYSCGNFYRENEEQCDANDFGGQTCESFGLISGNLLCTNQCFISLAQCESQAQPGAGSPSSGGGGGSPGTPTGFSPGEDSPRQTKVIISGKSYPHAEVHILLDGKVIGLSEADAKANFYFETSDVPAGVASLSFWSADKDEIKSTLLTITLRIVSGAVTTITGVYLSPSINTDRKSVDKGVPITIYGQTVQETSVFVHVNSEQEFVEKTASQESGDWQLVFDTSALEEDYHTAKALFQMEVSGNVIKSGFSRSVSFYVGREISEGTCPGADLNGDKRVNITDFSILLYWWGTKNTCADQDHNGKVDLVDFSIMMYHWTG